MEIKYFYKQQIQVEIDQEVLDNFGVRDIVQDIPDMKLIVTLAEWILGIAVQSERKTYYLDLIKGFKNEEVSNTLVQIIYNVLQKGTDDENNNDEDNSNNYISDKAEDNEDTTTYLIRINNLEKENIHLTEELSELKESKLELLKKNIELEDSVKLLEQQVIEQTYIAEMVKQRETSLNDNQEESLNLHIQVSELKGKLKVTETMLTKVKEEKEIMHGELKEKILKLNKEIEALQEKGIKYDHLVNKMEKEKLSFNSFHTLRIKLENAELKIKDQEDKIRQLKNFDQDKSKYLKKIEDLNAALIEESQKIEESENDKKKYIDRIVTYENEITELKSQVINYRSNENNNNFSGLLNEDDIVANNIHKMEGKSLNDVIEVTDNEEKRELELKLSEQKNIYIEDLKNRLKIEEDTVKLLKESNNKYKNSLGEFQMKYDETSIKEKEMIKEEVSELKKRIAELEKEVEEKDDMSGKELDAMSTFFHSFIMNYWEDLSMSNGNNSAKNLHTVSSMNSNSYRTNY